MTIRLLQALIISSLILLSIYGIDAADKASRTGGGFLPADITTTGIIFGGTSIALSTAAFLISKNESSSLVSVILIINGVPMVIAGVMTSGNRSLGPYMVLGFGVWAFVLVTIKMIKRKKSSRVK